VKSIFLDYSTVSTGDLDPRSLLDAAPQLELRDLTPQDRVAEIIDGNAIVLLNKLQLTREIIFGARDLRLIALAATGTNNVDLQAAQERGVAVCNIRDYCSASVAQHVLGVLLMLTHHLRDYSRDAMDGTWAQSRHFTILSHPIRELTGRTLGIVGWGVLGQAVARACEAALGMKVLVAQRPSSPSQPGRLPLDELLARADVVSLHCPLTDETRNLIDAPRIACMKPDALLINTARGALVDLAALAEALRGRRLGGAAIDVLPQEPPVDGSPLFDPDIPNLIVTPHTAWAAREARQRCLDEMAANIRNWREGGRRGRVV
jgi:glycerate dehydrogenase